MSDRYIQSIYSKDARVWEVRDCPYNCASPPNNDWCVECPEDPKGKGRLHWLPKSEYVEVPAPERWEDVTKELAPSVSRGNWLASGYVCLSVNDRYRLKKVQVNFIGPGVEHGSQQGVAFIIERKVKS
jgi:hypothetical protein